MWTKLDASKLKNVGGADETAIAFRVYGLDGQNFPRLVISLYDSLNDMKNTAIIIITNIISHPIPPPPTDLFIKV